MKKVGFIGLGIMGRAMAENLLKAGYELLVLEKNKASKDLEGNGVELFHSSKEIAERCDVLITMLPDSPEVEEVVYGEGGVLEGMRKGTLFIDMSTISPSTARKLEQAFKEKGVEALDAPVSGGQSGATSGTLSIMVGGSVESYKRALPLFQVFGKNIVHVGESGAGQMTKACNQIIVGMTIQAVSEAFALAEKANVDLEKMREALLGGFAQSKILDLHGQRIIQRNFEPGFRIRLHRKDMNIALQSGKDFSVPLYGSSLVASHMDAMIGKGNGDLDHSAIFLLMEELSGL
jgi:2-hydroxy-3-oxopropionate reductase